MTAIELIHALLELDPSSIVVLSRDSEGNSMHELDIVTYDDKDKTILGGKSVTLWPRHTALPELVRTEECFDCGEETLCTGVTSSGEAIPACAFHGGREVDAHYPLGGSLEPHDIKKEADLTA